ncbi:MAG: hypothetical protein COY39_05050 [Alphaproteobacteria bacterium CG_4_10_14_0_8_um_filter_37_21]|nr:MAG: hypothetical protein COY39_05050 [Alphaproteobacteria bacterium CG_4_10_14_0_8_um_filter_37_21]
MVQKMTQELFTTYKPPSFDGPSDQAQFMTQGEQLTLKEKSYNEGFQKGFNDGQKYGHDTALEEHDTYVKQILEKLYDAIQILKENNQDYTTHLTQHVNYSVALIIKKLFPFYLKREGKSELRDFVKHTVTSLLDKNGIKIFLNPSMLPHVKKYIDQQPDKNEGIHLMEDNTLDNYACTMKWKCGGGLYDINKLHDKIDVLLKNGLNLRKTNIQTETLSTENEAVNNTITESENV